MQLAPGERPALAVASPADAAREALFGLLPRFSDLEALAAGAAALIAPLCASYGRVASAARLVDLVKAATDAARDRADALAVAAHAPPPPDALVQLAAEAASAGALFEAARGLLLTAEDHDKREGLPLLFAGLLLDQAKDQADRVATALSDQAAGLSLAKVAA